MQSSAQSHSHHSPKNLTNWHRSGRDIRLAPLIIAYQIKWHDTAFALCTTQKMKFFNKDFFSRCDQIRRKLRIWLYSLKKSSMENFIFCTVLYFRYSYKNSALRPQIPYMTIWCLSTFLYQCSSITHFNTTPYPTYLQITPLNHTSKSH